VARWLLSGTTETATQNVKLNLNGVVFATLSSISAAGWATLVLEKVTINGSNNVSLAVVSAATAGAVYSTQIEMTRIG
jgi:hypothetical protein